MLKLLFLLGLMANPTFSRAVSTPFVSPTSPQSVTIQVDVGDTVVVTVESSAAASGNLAVVAGVSNGGSYSSVDTQTSAAGFTRTEVWRTTVAGGGTSASTVQVSFTGSPASMTISVETVQNGGGYGLSAKATGNGTTQSATVAMTSANGLLVGGVSSDLGGTAAFTMSSPNTRRAQNGTTTAAVDTAGAVGDNPSVGIANLTLTSTTGVAGNWAMVAFEITPAAATPAPLLAQPKGMPQFAGILKNVRIANYVVPASVISTAVVTLVRRTLNPFGTHSGGRQGGQ